jgi:hypothetical protein
MKPYLSRKALVFFFGTAIFGTTWVDAAIALPPIQRSGAIEYLTGGVGLDESTAVRNASKKWPLVLEFAVKDKQRVAYAADVSVLISDGENHPALQVKSDGPFLLAKMEPGKYAVTATLAGKTLRKQVIVVSGQPTRVEFLWPTGTGDQRP